MSVKRNWMSPRFWLNLFRAPHADSVPSPDNALEGEPDRVFAVPVLLPSGERVPGEFRAWEQSPEDPEKALVVLRLPGRVYQASEETYFAALNLIRQQLEPEGIIPDCYGCSRNVYPSPMSLSMGYGEKAVRMRMGQPARREDQVSIFKTGPDTKPVTVAEQERFYREWLESFGNQQGGEG